MTETATENTSINPKASPGDKSGYKLEIGKSTFRDRILENCIYVDKTQYIYQLINRDSNCFLSRPRRFGKSLLISTFKELFSGSKELFKNCWIYDKIEWQEYPIIHLDFIRVDYKTMGLEQALDETLNLLASQFDVRLIRSSIKGKFDELIDILSNKSKSKKVVVLVDEYDKPIIDYMNDTPQAVKNRDILKNFYSILKAQNANIKFLLITGVSKFSRISVFSDLNHLKDITIHPLYSKMLGYTQEEIEHYFSPYITEWENRTDQGRNVLFKNLKDYYNGYSWDGVNFVYNPFSILSFFDTYQFNNYWFATGSPTFLIDILKKSGVFLDQYERMRVSGAFFEKYDIGTFGKDNISSLLFQTGYLTVKEIKGDEYTLSYPNREVRTSFLKYLLEGFSNKSENVTNEIASKIKQALSENKIEDFILDIKSLLSSIPYNIQVENREAYYHSLIYIALKISMLDVQAEIQTAIGRSDIVVCMDRYIYIIEFKRDSAQSALEQIEEKQYYSPYLGKNKKIILLGIGLDETLRNIGDWIALDWDEKKKILPAGKAANKKPAAKSRPKKDNKNKIAKSKMEEKRRMVKQMLVDKLPIELIAKYSGLSEAEITNLQIKLHAIDELNGLIANQGKEKLDEFDRVIRE